MMAITFDHKITRYNGFIVYAQSEAFPVLMDCSFSESRLQAID